MEPFKIVQNEATKLKPCTRKGSWKGGTIGHSIEMPPGELHADAFRRYCAEHNMTFSDPLPSTDGERQ